MSQAMFEILLHVSTCGTLVLKLYQIYTKKGLLNCIPGDEPRAAPGAAVMVEQYRHGLRVAGAAVTEYLDRDVYTFTVFSQ